MLIDQFMSRYDVSIAEHTIVLREQAATFRAARDLDLMTVHTPLVDLGRHVPPDVAVDAFTEFDEPGWGKIAASFSVLPYGEGSTLLTTNVVPSRPTLTPVGRSCATGDLDGR
jgi:hypothetical protein